MQKRIDLYTRVMNIFFWSLSIIVSILIVLPYMRDIYTWKTKPHTHSWLPWTILTGIACIIQIKNGEDLWWAGAMGASAIICGYIFILFPTLWGKTYYHFWYNLTYKFMFSHCRMAFYRRWFTSDHPHMSDRCICFLPYMEKIVEKTRRRKYEHVLSLEY